MKKEKKIEYAHDWLSTILRPTLGALKGKNFDEYQIASHIQSITENELYDLWIRWTTEQEVYMSEINPKNGMSFVFWLKEGCPVELLNNKRT